MPRRQPQIAEGEGIARPMEREGTTGSCRYVGTPDFAGPPRLDEMTGKTQDSLVMQHLSCEAGGKLAVLNSDLEPDLQFVFLRP